MSSLKSVMNSQGNKTNQTKELTYMGQKDEDGYYAEECHFFFQLWSANKPIQKQIRSKGGQGSKSVDLAAPTDWDPRLLDPKGAPWCRQHYFVTK